MENDFLSHLFGVSTNKLMVLDRRLPSEQLLFQPAFDIYTLIAYESNLETITALSRSIGFLIN